MDEQAHPVPLRGLIIRKLHRFADNTDGDPVGAPRTDELQWVERAAVVFAEDLVGNNDELYLLK